MGYSQEQIGAVIDEIEAFAEIGDYFDQPVRTYSSGMQARVAFAVATTFRPDILIIDEALSVGDIFFAIKCLERMESFQNEGTSILFVTHDTGSLRRFCDRGIVLKQGKILHDGDILKAISLYALEGKVINQAPKDRDSSTTPQEAEKSAQHNTPHKVNTFSDGIATVNSTLLSDRHRAEKLVFNQGSSIHFHCSYKILRPLNVPYFHVTILNSNNIVIYAKDSFQFNLKHKQEALQGEVVGFGGEIEANLAPGAYIILLALHSAPPEALELSGIKLLELKETSRKVIINAAIEFTVLAGEDGSSFYGLVDLPSKAILHE